MKRKMIEIDESKCNGCGQCVSGCAEGALALVGGKATLVNEIFCDGLGACLGSCPTGALEIVEREAPAFDERAVAAHFNRPPAGGCPGVQPLFDSPPRRSVAPPHSEVAIASELTQWPTQLHLVPPTAPFFENRELVVLSTCAPSASPDVNWRFIRGRAIAIACPKLDRTDGYVEKLAEILRSNAIPTVIVVRMEVPCCGGLTALVRAAARQSGRANLRVQEATVARTGEWLGTREVEYE